MSSREEIVKIIGTAALILLEYYAMQPYHAPLYAQFWQFWLRIFQNLASFFGWCALHAENNYYVAVSSGA